MKIYLAYRFTERNESELISKLKLISKYLEDAGHKPFVFYRDVQNWKREDIPEKEIMKKAFNTINDCDVIVNLIESDNLSEGMLLENGYALALNKKIILLIKSNVKRYEKIRELATDIIEYEELEELKDKLVF